MFYWYSMRSVFSQLFVGFVKCLNNCDISAEKMFILLKLIENTTKMDLRQVCLIVLISVSHKLEICRKTLQANVKNVA